MVLPRPDLGIELGTPCKHGTNRLAQPASRLTYWAMTGTSPKIDLYCHNPESITIKTDCEDTSESLPRRVHYSLLNQQFRVETSKLDSTLPGWIDKLIEDRKTDYMELRTKSTKNIHKLVDKLRVYTFRQISWAAETGIKASNSLGLEDTYMNCNLFKARGWIRLFSSNMINKDTVHGSSSTSILQENVFLIWTVTNISVGLDHQSVKLCCVRGDTFIFIFLMKPPVLFIIWLI